MGEYSDVLGIALFLLSLSMIAIAGGAETFVFNFDYQNASYSGDSVGINLEEVGKLSTYYDSDTGKIRVNESAINGSDTLPAISFNPNITGLESFTVDAEVPSNYYNDCGGQITFDQAEALFSREIYDGVNSFENRRSETAAFTMTWDDAFLASSECREMLYSSNITDIEASFPSTADVGTLEFIDQFTSADSGYQWFNYIVMGAIGVLVSFIILKWVRGS